MLRVTLHAASVRNATLSNRVGWVDIGYERLDVLADYKCVAGSVGEGATPPRLLKRYPRWSGSLWDLVARAIAICYAPDSGDFTEVVPSFEAMEKRGAFVDVLCAIVSHSSFTEPAGQTVGELEILRQRPARNAYAGYITEDLGKRRLTGDFEYAPRYLRPAELALQAILHALEGQALLFPPRPPLSLPIPIEKNGKRYVLVHRIAEPARTGLVRWLARQGRNLELWPEAREGAATEADFLAFLATAV